MAAFRPPPCPAVIHSSSFKIELDPVNPNLLLKVGRTRKPLISCNSISQNCNSLEFADNPFEQSATEHGFLKNQFMISKMIREYTENGMFEDAIELYLKMLNLGHPIEEFCYFPSLIKAFGVLSNFENGRQIHGHVLKLGVLKHIYPANSLLAMYWRCGEVEDAVYLFEKMQEKDSVSWNTMISGFNQSMRYAESLMMFSQMMHGFRLYPNRIACISALSSCTSCESLIHGREIHAFAIKSGLTLDAFLANGLIELYMKCKDLKNAERVFKSSLQKDSLRRNTVIWNVMILGFVHNGCMLKALMLFKEMLVLGIQPDSSTMVASLVLCSRLLGLEIGRQIHGYIFRFALENNAKVETALLDMYGKCGDIETALIIFGTSSNRNFIMWGAVITGCAQNGFSGKALEMFASFISEGGLADSVTVLAVLRACSSLTCKIEGMEIHALTVKAGFDSDGFIGAALVDMYAKCRDMQSAQKVFLRLPTKDLISWNSLISGYAQNGQADEALNAFRDMQLEQIRPNTVTVASILSVCAHLSIMILCKAIHGYLTRNRFEQNVLVSNSLLATYARCGDIDSSWCVFQKMIERDEISWNSMLLGYGMHGRIDDMFMLFDKMKTVGMTPDHVSFTSVLSACSHAGRVDDAWKQFRSMIEDYDLVPELEQYTCMVDLLGRAGHLDQAYDLIRDMPCEPDARIWGSLLGSCKNHGDECLAEHVASHIFELDPTSIGYCVLLANIYDDSGKWSEVARIRAHMKDKGLKKTPGCSWIETNNKTHVFTAGDRSHYQSEEIYAELENLTAEIRVAGYSPQYIA